MVSLINARIAMVTMSGYVVATSACSIYLAISLPWGKAF
jgi:hypothetical protein